MIIKVLRYIGILLCLSCLMYSCENRTEYIEDVEKPQRPPNYYKEAYRGAFHFSPEQNWMNDPNGMVYYNGEYHLFYQYNPFGQKWGHMSWGHAVSKDLLHWEHLPVALYEEKNVSDGDTTMIFSGSAVMDKGNKAKLCDGKGDCMVAIYTGHVHNNLEAVNQNQSIAFSKDRGRTFIKYDGNPVLSSEKIDFRDPKVFWHESTQKWIMSVNLPTEYKVQFYGSTDLKAWELLSEFGEVGDMSRVWECPDLFPLPLADDDEVQKWVLIISSGSPHNTFVGMQYFIGDFDGTTFTPTESTDEPIWLEYGKDFYAAVTWNNTETRKILLGWLNNWEYANDIPTAPWRGMMSIPRELALKQFEEGVRLIQKPIEELKKIRGTLYDFKDLEIGDEDNTLGHIRTNTAEIIMEVTIFDSTEFGIEVLKTGDESTIIGYDPIQQELFIDRRTSGQVDFNARFPSRDAVSLPLTDGQLKLHIFIDKSVVEVFANDGYRVMTSRIFPKGKGNHLQLYSKGKSTKMKELKVWEMNSTWE